MIDKIVHLPIGDNPPKARLLYGCDVREGLALLASDSIHCVATSPPYWGLRDYGTSPSIWGGIPNCTHTWSYDKTVRKGNTNGRGDLGSALTSVDSIKTLAPGIANDHGDTHKQYRDDKYATCSNCGAWLGQLGHEPSPDLYVEHMVDVFREIRRVLRHDGTVWLNIGDSYNSGASGSIRGSTLTGGQDYQFKSKSNRFGRKITDSVKPKDLVGIPWRVALALQADGWWLRNDIIWRKENPLPSPVRDRLSCTYEHVFLLTKSPKYFFDLDAIRVPHTFGDYSSEGVFVPKQNWLSEDAPDRKMLQTEGQLGTYAGPPRRFGRGQYHPSGKNPGDHWRLEDDVWATMPSETRVAILETRVKELEDCLQRFSAPGDVWDLPTQPFHGSHFAVWPMAIPERCIRAGTSEHGCCSICGAPWERITHRRDAQGNAAPSGGLKAITSQETREAGGIGRLDGGRRSADQSTFHNNPRKRVAPLRNPRGWAPSCTCNAELVRCKVLDPFSGSATTGRVALRLNRDYIGLDLNESYLSMAVARVQDNPPPMEPATPETGSVLDIFDNGVGDG